MPASTIRIWISRFPVTFKTGEESIFLENFIALTYWETRIEYYLQWKTQDKQNDIMYQADLAE